MIYPFPSSGLYAIVNADRNTAADICLDVEEAIIGGARVIQYRHKAGTPQPSLAQYLLKLCHAYGIPLIVNDDIELARAIRADGVHLGRDDQAIDRARERLGNNAIIGVSCYDSISRGITAQEKGAAYVAFGRFFPSKSKPDATPADKSILRRAKTAVQVPVVAIGGITPENGMALLEAGADLLAVIDGIFGASDKREAATAYRELFRNTAIGEF